jgi:hypothetical protein
MLEMWPSTVCMHTANSRFATSIVPAIASLVVAGNLIRSLRDVVVVRGLG